MLEAGLASTTMVQRSKTAVVPTENFSRIARLGYNATIPTALTDRNSMCKPLAVERLRVKISMDHAAAQEPERWEALSKAGFKVEPYGDLITTIWDKWGGHYMDVGASAKIAKGLVSDVLFFFLSDHCSSPCINARDGARVRGVAVLTRNIFCGQIRSR